MRHSRCSLSNSCPLQFLSVSHAHEPIRRSTIGAIANTSSATAKHAPLLRIDRPLRHGCRRSLRHRSVRSMGAMRGTAKVSHHEQLHDGTNGSRTPHTSHPKHERPHAPRYLPVTCAQASTRPAPDRHQPVSSCTAPGRLTSDRDTDRAQHAKDQTAPKSLSHRSRKDCHLRKRRPSGRPSLSAMPQHVPVHKVATCTHIQTYGAHSL